MIDRRVERDRELSGQGLWSVSRVKSEGAERSCRQRIGLACTREVVGKHRQSNTAQGNRPPRWSPMLHEATARPCFTAAAAL